MKKRLRNNTSTTTGTSSPNNSSNYSSEPTDRHVNDIAAVGMTTIPMHDHDMLMSMHMDSSCSSSTASMQASNGYNNSQFDPFSMLDGQYNHLNTSHADSLLNVDVPTCLAHEVGFVGDYGTHVQEPALYLPPLETSRSSEEENNNVNGQVNDKKSNINVHLNNNNSCFNNSATAEIASFKVDHHHHQEDMFAFGNHHGQAAGDSLRVGSSEWDLEGLMLQDISSFPFLDFQVQ